MVVRMRVSMALDSTMVAQAQLINFRILIVILQNQKVRVYTKFIIRHVVSPGEGVKQVIYNIYTTKHKNVYNNFS